MLKPYVIAGKLSLKLFDLGDSFILRTLGRMAGAETIRELAEFIFAFQGMYGEFRDRSRRVRELLVSEDLAFVLVTSTQPNQLAAAQAFRAGLRAQGMRVRGVVVNRVRNPPLVGADLAQLRQRLAALLPGDDELAAAVARAVEQEAALAELAVTAVARLREQFGSETRKVARFARSPTGSRRRLRFSLPELPLDAHDLESLVALHASFL